MAQDIYLLFSTMVACFLALLFVRAALHKLGDHHRFEGVLADYAILPNGALRASAYALPVAELATALLLFLPTMRVFGAMLGGGLLCVYSLAMAVNLIRGHTLLDCGCGGPPEPISWLLVARNAVLVGLITPTALGTVPATSSSFASEIAALGIAALAGLLWLAAEAALFNARQMHATLPLSSATWSGS